MAKIEAPPVHPNTRRMTHGFSRTTSVLHRKAYRAWCHMKDRCLNSNHPKYHRYGGRGIKLFPEWLTFEGFIKDVGLPPSSDLTLERMDNDGDYEPNNVT